MVRSIKGNIDDTTLLTKNKVEKFQINIFKNLLGVSKSTSNMSILLELGRYPITSYMHYQTIKDFARLSSLKMIDSCMKHSIGKKKKCKEEKRDSYAI